MFSGTSVCARRTGAAAHVEQRRRECVALLAVRGRRASRSDARAASQAFERMHNALSHRVKTLVPGGNGVADVLFIEATGTMLCTLETDAAVASVECV